MTDFTIIRVYTREKARYEGKPLPHAIVAYIHSLRTQARCVVLRGVEGLYETGEMVSASIVEGSYDLPVIIDIVLPTAEAEAVVAKLETMVTDGCVTLSGATVTSFRTPEGPLPSHLLVRDIMTREPISAHRDFTIRVAVELLLDRGLKSLPVVDDHGSPIGILTQGDLARKADMPVRLGLLDTLNADVRDGWLRSLEKRGVSEVMTIEPKTVRDDQKASSAVHFMARARMKRLPVVDAKGRLVGMLSRIDVLRALAKGRESPKIGIESRGDRSRSPRIRDLEERDALTLSADTTIQEAIDALARDSSQRAGVIGTDGRLIGLVTDRLLVEAIDKDESRHLGLGRLLPPRSSVRKIADIMLHDPISINEEASTEEALRLMTERGLKRIPVVDAEGKFKGMVRRDSLLLALTGES